MNRRKSREIAMRLLFEISINKEEYRAVLEHFLEENEEETKDLDIKYIEKVLEGVQQYKEELDSKIEANLVNWKFNRISKINLAILRISIYEMIYEEDIPKTVSLNEAVELSKKYAEEKSYAFVNGVLDKVMKQTD
ncbi:MAG: transcription antitermination factor NusB [Bacillota bacterium]|nr:transcription antitermination factor NusB [Bacillota bacterium]